MPKFRYQADNEVIHIGTMSADRIAVAGTQIPDGTPSNIRVTVSKSNREHGIRPRGVRLARTIGTPPDTAVKYAFLPVVSVAAFDTPAFELGATLTYGGFVWEIVARVSEDF